MAEEVTIDHTSQEEISPGAEPGSSRNSVLMSTDSYEDVDEYLDNSINQPTHKRLPSGTIHEIKCESDTVVNENTPNDEESDGRETPTVSQDSQSDNTVSNL